MNNHFLHTAPPKWPLKCLRFFLKEEFLEEVEGDMEEIFQDNLERFSPAKAKRIYVWDTLKLLRPIMLKNIFNPQFHHSTAMFKHNFIISYRTLIKNKGFSLINVGGLAIGMTVAMLIALWVKDELSYNHYFPKHDRIAKVMRSGSINGETHTFPYLPYALGDELKTTYGNHFNHVLLALHPQDFSIKVENRHYAQQGIFVESGVGDMLDLNMIDGTADALKDPHAILLSSSSAYTIFGEEIAVGKVLKVNESLDVTVGGVYEDLPQNTEFQEVDFWLSWDLFANSNQWVRQQGFDINFLQIYVELKENESAEQVSPLIKDIILDNIAENEDYVSVNPQLTLYPMNRWHLYTQWKNGESVGSRMQFVWLFGLIGLFVLILACINFMNLSTARSEKRSREVGIRKSLGSIRRHLIGQFLSESLLITLFAFLVGLILLYVSLPWFNELADKQIQLVWNNPLLWGGGLCFVIMTSLLAGSYPALYLSSFEAVKVLKGTFRGNPGGSHSRKILVVVQFTVSIALIIGTVVVFQQIQFAKDRPIGYSQDRLISLPMNSPEFKDKQELVRNELMKQGVAEEVSQSMGAITGLVGSDGGFSWKGKAPDLQTDFAIVIASAEFGKTLNWQLTSGRDFSREILGDSSGVIINETAAKIMGLDNPVGELLNWESNWYKNGDYEILGVVEDVIMQSPFDPVNPTIFLMGASKDLHWMHIRMKDEMGTRESLEAIEEVYTSILPTTPFNYSFVDEDYATKFGEEERIGKVAAFFAILAIFISCLGLFGLSSFIAEQRTKEIGIRKVLGASLIDLWRLLSKEFVILVGVSCLISIPIAAYFLQKWLEGYAYHVDLSIWVFLFAGLAALMIALLTVSFQAFKVAIANPVKSLRTE